MAKTDQYTIDQVVNALMESHGVVLAAARALNCNRQTVMNYVHRYATVKQALQDAREAMTDIAESALYQQIVAGDAWAVCFYLKTQGRGRGYVEQRDVKLSGDDTAPMKFTIRITNDDHDEAD